MRVMIRGSWFELWVGLGLALVLQYIRQFTIWLIIGSDRQSETKQRKIVRFRSCLDLRVGSNKST